MLSRSIITRLLIGATIACGVAAMGALAYQLMRVGLSKTILTKIDRLALQPPEGVPELEWAVRVYWTHNLHCSAWPQVNASYSFLRELNRDLDESISKGPDMQTIDDLWDRYATMSNSGAKYRMKIAPIRDLAVESIAREGDD